MVTLVVKKESAYDIRPDERDGVHRLCVRHNLPPLFFWHTMLVWARCRHCFERTRVHLDTALTLCLSLVLSFHGEPHTLSLDMPSRLQLSVALKAILGHHRRSLPRPTPQNVLWSLFLQVLGGRLR